MLNQSDRQDVVDTVHEFCRAFDMRDWAALRRCLAASLMTDYSSFRGTPPARMTNDEFVALRQTALARLVTQHLSLNHLVAFAGEQARCRFDFVIHRWPLDTADSRFFDARQMRRTTGSSSPLPSMFCATRAAPNFTEHIASWMTSNATPDPWPVCGQGANLMIQSDFPNKTDCLVKGVVAPDCQ